MGGREKFTVDIACLHCGQKGHAVWEENALGNRRTGVQRALIRLSPGFHAQSGRTQSGDPLIGCDSCGTVQPD
jgi:hypothetical protein